MASLDEAIAHDPELGALIDGSVGRFAFAKYFIDNRPRHATDIGLWKAFVMEQVSRALYSWSGSETSLKDRRGDSDLPAFGIQRLDFLPTHAWNPEPGTWSAFSTPAPVRRLSSALPVPMWASMPSDTWSTSAGPEGSSSKSRS